MKANNACDNMAVKCQSAWHRCRPIYQHGGASRWNKY